MQEASASLDWPVGFTAVWALTLLPALLHDAIEKRIPPHPVCLLASELPAQFMRHMNSVLHPTHRLRKNGLADVRAMTLRRVIPEVLEAFFLGQEDS